MNCKLWPEEQEETGNLFIEERKGEEYGENGTLFTGRKNRAGDRRGVRDRVCDYQRLCRARVAFNCRSQEHLEQALARYHEIGIDARGYLCDVTDEAQVKSMVEEIRNELGIIDILVNNAGIIKRIPMTEMSVEEFRQVVDIDLNAPFIMSKAVIPDMIKQGHGKISAP